MTVISHKVGGSQKLGWVIEIKLRAKETMFLFATWQFAIRNAISKAC